MNKLPLSYYQRPDIVQLSRDLLGKKLMTCIGSDPITGGIIVETEAYAGPQDRASHAYNNRRTKRTEVMFHGGGVGYVYLCYGIHHLFNIVTNVAGIPHAILIRAISPTDGIDTIEERRKKKITDPTITSGPGTVTQALGVSHCHNGITLDGDTIWLEEGASTTSDATIAASPRIGIDYAGDYALLPWRFCLEK